MPMLHAGRFQLDLSRPHIMGILNVTPDSFSDGGHFNSLDSALQQVERMQAEGADIIDIGAESTRPGAKLVSVEEEIKRLTPIVSEIQKQFEVCISIDTNKPIVMRVMLDLGVDMVNDVRGFTASGALQTVAEYEAAICIMHMQGLPETMQQAPSYRDLITEVKSFLLQQANTAERLGITKNRISIDPGFGFGKMPEQNMLLLKHCDALAVHYPVLFGLSRKSTLGTILGDKTADRTQASVTGALLAIQNGASMVRVHDVKETADAIKVWQAMLV